jgi:hypothetical protein
MMNCTDILHFRARVAVYGQGYSWATLSQDMDLAVCSSGPILLAGARGGSPDRAKPLVLVRDRERPGVDVTVWVSQFLPSGAQRIRQATAAHIGRPVAILIDGRVVMAPVVRSPIRDSAMITGRFTQAEAERIADGIAGR